MCNKFDFEIAGLAQSLEDDSFTNYVGSVMEIRDIQAQIDNKNEHLQQVHDEMHWFIISGGAEEVITNLYKTMIDELKADEASLQKDLKNLQADIDLERGIIYNDKFAMFRFASFQLF